MFADLDRSDGTRDARSLTRLVIGSIWRDMVENSFG